MTTPTVPDKPAMLAVLYDVAPHLRETARWRINVYDWQFILAMWRDAVDDPPPWPPAQPWRLFGVPVEIVGGDAFPELVITCDRRN